MKTNLKYILSMVLIHLMLASCTDEAIDTSSKAAFIESITGSWNIGEGAVVTLNDLDITNALKDFELTLTNDLSYSSNSEDLALQPLPWPASGSLAINDALTQFTRDDGLVIEVTVNDSGTDLTMSFFADESTSFTGGRIRDIAEGRWKFEFKRK